MLSHQHAPIVDEDRGIVNRVTPRFLGAGDRTDHHRHATAGFDGLGPFDGQLHADGHTYTWLSWSDGQSLTHEISTPASDTTYTASFGCDVLAEVGSIAVDRGSGDEIDLSWPAVSDGCLAAGSDRYRIYASASAAPASPPGSFPSDPGFTLVGGSATESFDYTPDPGHRFFLIVATGTDGAEGPVGHYGF